jgi:hypothetical protein
VADVTGGDSETELQGGSGDEQVLEGDAYAPGCLVALNAPGESGRLDGDRMHRHVADEFIDEGLSPLPAFFRSGTLNAVRQFHDGHDRKADLDFSVTRFELFQDLPDGVASPLAGYHDARVEN